jgi:hypothetical protein
MLEVCISLRRGDYGEGKIAEGEKDIKKAGDIIVAKKSPAPWGKEERRLFLITFLEDDILEAEIAKDKVRSYPYAVYVTPKALPPIESANKDLIINKAKTRDDLLPEPSMTPVMVNRSKYRVKVGQSIAGVKQDNMFSESHGLESTITTDDPSTPTTKTGLRQYCETCRKVKATDKVCPVCKNPMAEFLVLSDLYFDDSPRT